MTDDGQQATQLTDLELAPGEPVIYKLKVN